MRLWNVPEMNRSSSTTLFTSLTIRSSAVSQRQRQGCQIFVDYYIPKFDECTKLLQNRTNGCKFFQNKKEIYPMAIKYIKIIHSKAFQKIPKLVFLVCKYVHMYTIWQP
jgi:hypothetical protein